MTTLVEPSPGSDLIALNRRNDEAESWGLLLVPVLLCIAMLIFAFATKAQPAPDQGAGSRSCVSSSESAPKADC